MKNTLLIRRYAKAFLDFAIQNNMTEEGLADLELITNTLNDNRELRNILFLPFVSKSKKENIVTKVFKDKISDKTLKLIILILENNRQNIISEIFATYRNLYYEYKNIALVTITTAVEIDEKRQQDIIKIIKEETTGNIQIINKIDREIIGGFIIDYLDCQYDASIRTKLRKLESLFTDNLYVRGY